MWLINTSTLDLEYFNDPEASPEYAILSHTWGDDEVTFQDFGRRESMSSAKHDGEGMEKIRRTCQLARQGRHRLRYAWVDTCCIDKTSSAELSESINSMFHWYAKAKVCFVHLSDMSAAADFADLGALPHAGDTKPSAVGPRPLRWFTRGWTLQELIAPREVLFYDKFWDIRGAKSNPYVRSQLSRITGISPSILEDGSEENLRNITLGQRMSWASQRETTRKEDIAYCLLGIFQVNMPLLYGEGGKAFHRLQEEIIKVSPDLSLLAWSQLQGDLQGFRGILASHPQEFQALRDCDFAKFYLAEADDEEAMMTNKGLRIRTSSLFTRLGTDQELTRDSDGVVYLSLGCTISGQLTAIALCQSSDRVYARFEPEITVPLGPDFRRLRSQKILLTREFAPNFNSFMGEHYKKTTQTTVRALGNRDYRLKIMEVWPANLFGGVFTLHHSALTIYGIKGAVGYLDLGLLDIRRGVERRFEPLLVVIHCRSSRRRHVEFHTSLLRGSRALRFQDFIRSLHVFDPVTAERKLNEHCEDTGLLEQCEPSPAVSVREETTRGTRVGVSVRFLPNPPDDLSTLDGILEVSLDDNE